MTQTAQSPPVPPTLPMEPTMSPSWLRKVASLLLLVAGPLLAFWDPSGKLNSGMAQALVVLAFVLVSGGIFIVDQGIEGVHKYGWSMKTLDWVWTSSRQQIDADILEFKNLYPQIAPMLQKLPGYQANLDSLSVDVKVAQERMAAATASTGMTPSQIVAAIESYTGVPLPKMPTSAAAQPAAPAPAAPPPAPPAAS